MVAVFLTWLVINRALNSKGASIKVCICTERGGVEEMTNFAYGSSDRLSRNVRLDAVKGGPHVV